MGHERGQPPEVHLAKPSRRLNSHTRGWEGKRRVTAGEGGRAVLRNKGNSSKERQFTV